MKTLTMYKRRKKAFNKQDIDNTGSLLAWAVKLTAELGDDEKKALQKIKTQGTPEFQTAALVLQNLVIKAAKHVQNPTKSKPGPKKSVNQTDDDIDTLASCIRMILKMQTGTPRLRVYEKLIKALNDLNIFLSQNLLLTGHESMIIQTNFERLVKEKLAKEKVVRDYRFEDIDSSTFHKTVESELNRKIGIIIPLDSASDFNTWGQSVFSSCNPLKNVGKGKKRFKVTQNLFVVIAQLLDLHKAQMLKSKTSVVREHKIGPECTLFDFPNFDSFQPLGLQRKEILWTAVSRLYCLNTLLQQTQFGWAPADAEDLMMEVENYTHTMSSRRVKKNPLVEGMHVINRVITTASVRQGISPFSQWIAPQHGKFPSPALPGVVSIGEVQAGPSLDQPRSKKIQKALR